MFDLNRDFKKTIAEFGLMVTITVALAACSTSRMSPDAFDSEIGNIQVEETVEPEVTENAVTGDVEVAETAPTYNSGHSKIKSKKKHKRLAKATAKSKAKLKKSHIASLPKNEPIVELPEQGLTSAATVGSSMDVPPTLPPAPELLEMEMPLAGLSPVESVSKHWMFVIGIGILVGAVALGWRSRRRGAARRLILN